MSDLFKEPLFNSNFQKEPLFKSELDKNTTLKSRKLSISEFFDILQEEYIVCELRSKIYPSAHTNKRGETINPSDYWRSLMCKKKEKIVDLAARNSLFSIFDDKRVMVDFYKRVVPEWGFPKFIYKDDHQRLLQEKWDIHNYYSRGSQVKVLLDSKIRQGVIKNTNFLDNKITIMIDSLLVECELSTVSRVL